MESRTNMLQVTEARPKTANTYVYESIRQAIWDGHLPPGARLNEQDLAASLGVSRTPIREVLQRLQMEGLVEVIPYRGATVVIPNADDVMKEYTLRAALEGMATELAVPRLTEDNIAELRDLTAAIIDRLEGDDVEKFLQINRAFHDELYGLSGNRHLCQLISEDSARVNYYRRFYLFARPGGLDVEKKFHREMLDACVSRDVERARRLVQDSCLDAARAIIEAFRLHQGTSGPTR
jgi:DNA-binding GntR family transcriptional regulator